MTRASIGQARGAEPRNHRREERGRNGQVVRRAASAAQRLLDLRERVPVVVVPAHVTEQREKMVEGALVVDPARLL